MVKVFLVEDEAIVRESIKRNIRWEALGFEFCGEAGDGEVAFSLIMEKRPDIVVSDIKMPFMDGLELGQLLRREMPQVRIVYLTGYGEFEYAKQAIHIGAVEYLLKPVSGAALTETLVRVGKEVEEEKEQQSFLEQYQLEMRDNVRRERDLFFGDLVSGGGSASGLLSRAAELGLALSSACYAVLRFCIYQKDWNEPYNEELLAAFGAVESALLAMDRAVLFRCGIEDYAVLVKGEREEAVAQTARAIRAVIEEAAAESADIHYFIGVGDTVARLLDIPKAYQSANHAFAHRYLSEGDEMVCFADEKGGEKDAPLDIDMLDVSKFDRSVTERFLRSGDASDAGYFVEELFAGIGADQLRSMLLRQYVIMDIYFANVAFLEKLGYARNTLLPDINEIAGQLAGVESAKSFLAGLFERTFELRDQSSRNRYGKLILQAQDYIRENYGQEAISLNMVARAVNISPTHFSTIFSRETGKTFIDYLTETRMEKAKELLLTNQKSSEIAYAVGYQNPHYFSFLFKKLNGLTPREFRNRGEREHEAGPS